MTCPFRASLAASVVWGLALCAQPGRADRPEHAAARLAQVQPGETTPKAQKRPLQRKVPAFHGSAMAASAVQGNASAGSGGDPCEEHRIPRRKSGVHGFCEKLHFGVPGSPGMCAKCYGHLNQYGGKCMMDYDAQFKCKDLQKVSAGNGDDPCEKYSLNNGPCKELHFPVPGRPDLCAKCYGNSNHYGGMCMMDYTAQFKCSDLQKVPVEDISKAQAKKVPVEDIRKAHAEKEDIRKAQAKKEALVEDVKNAAVGVAKRLHDIYKDRLNTPYNLEAQMYFAIARQLNNMEKELADVEKELAR